jgi:hypothetical protein
MELKEALEAAFPINAAALELERQQLYDAGKDSVWALDHQEFLDVFFTDEV